MELNHTWNSVGHDGTSPSCAGCSSIMPDIQTRLLAKRGTCCRCTADAAYCTGRPWWSCQSSSACMGKDDNTVRQKDVKPAADNKVAQMPPEPNLPIAHAHAITTKGLLATGAKTLPVGPPPTTTKDSSCWRACPAHAHASAADIMMQAPHHMWGLTWRPSLEACKDVCRHAAA